MRWSIVGLGSACALVLAAIVFGRVAPTLQHQQQDWRQRELAFLESVHDRIEAELAAQPIGAASLRGEQQAILHAMATVAKPMPAENIPTKSRILVATLDRSEQDTPPSAVRIAVPEAPVRAMPLLAALRIDADATATPAIGEAPELKAAVVPVDKTPVIPIIPDRPPTGQPAPEALGDPALTRLETALHAEKTERGLRVRLPAAVLFGATRSVLAPSAESRLAMLVELIKAMKPREVVVVGHTDTSKKEEVDMALSKERARAVSTWLTARRPDDGPHLVAQGYGGTRPVAPNENADGTDNPEGREQNRRIEILLRRH